MRNSIYILLFMILFSSCEQNNFELSNEADEYFFFRNKGADMPVWVKGNTQSKTFILELHGGPGSGSVGTFNAVKSFKILQEKYAMVYWDQRGAGITQGSYDVNTINEAQMVEDLEKLIVLLKNKYGSDISLFMHGGSWGGYLGFAYLVKGNNQQNIKGWISESGAHNIPLTGSAEQKMLAEFAQILIQKGENTDKWKEILDWCENTDTVNTTDLFYEANAYAHEATFLIQDSIADADIDISEVKNNGYFGMLSAQQIKGNNQSTEESPLSENFFDLNLSPELHKITIPTIIIGGKFDLIVPAEVAFDAYKKISSQHKQIVIFERSGHDASATNTQKFVQIVEDFIEVHR